MKKILGTNVNVSPSYPQHPRHQAKSRQEGTDKKGILELNVIHDPSSLSEAFVLCNKRAKRTQLVHEMHHLNYKLRLRSVKY